MAVTSPQAAPIANESHAAGGPEPEGEEKRSVEAAAELVPAPVGGALAFPRSQRSAARFYLDGLGTDKSRATAIDCLRRIAYLTGKEPDRWEMLHWETLSVEQILDIRKALVNKHRPATARLTMTILRQVLNAAFVQGRISGDRLLRLLKWPKIKGVSLTKGRMLSDEEIEKVRVHCLGLPPFEGTLTWAIFGCGLAAGLRRFEIAGLLVDDLSADARKLRVLGKGQKEAAQDLPVWLGRSIESWLRQRERFPFTTRSMFVHIDRQGGTLPRAQDRGMTPRQVWEVVVRVGVASGCDPFSTHDLRRTYLSTLIRERGLAMASRMARHSSSETTMLYDRRPAEELARATQAVEKWGGPR